MSTLDVPGAQLYYKTLGSGPLLVMIPGASGTADTFRTVAERLTSHYTVLIYDRRGFSRSRLDGMQDYTHRLRTDADDVRRLIEHVDDESASIFGASSGAIVGLAVLTHYPSLVGTLVAYEPPVMRLLPEGQQWVDFFTELYDQYRQSGVEPAMTRFRERTFPASDLRIMAHAPRNDANAVYWFEHELRQYPGTDLDLDTLTAHADNVLPAVGRDSGGYPCHEATTELGARLGQPVAQFPGGHVGFHAHPAEFARDLMHTFARTSASSPAHRPDTARHPASMSRADWNDTYTGMPHWDLGRPQPAFRALADTGALQGRVLDVGCGTGEHVLMAAELGLAATGVDFAPGALQAAERKARDRGCIARFLRRDARKLGDLGEVFDTVLDCGLFHIFDDDDRATYVASVRSVLPPGGRFFLLCFSDRQPGDQGPRRITENDIDSTFAQGWRIDSTERTPLASATNPDGIHGWLVTLTRT